MTTPSSPSAPTTAPRTSPGPTAVRRRSPVARARSWKGASACPCIVRWPGKVPAGKVENGIISGLDWFPTFVAAAGNPKIVDELKKGKTARRPKLQGPSRRLQPVGPDHRQGTVEAARSLLLRREHARRGRASTTYKYRFIDQPSGWLGGTVKVDWPILVNLRLDPFERTGLAGSLELLQLVRLRVLAIRSTSSRKSPSSPRPPSSSRRCRRGRASTSKPSSNRSSMRPGRTGGSEFVVGSRQ